MFRDPLANSLGAAGNKRNVILLCSHNVHTQMGTTSRLVPIFWENGVPAT
jgi:hypothetical protein